MQICDATTTVYIQKVKQFSLKDEYKDWNKSNVLQTHKFEQRQMESVS